MIVLPKIRGHICTTAHPAGCARHVQEQIDHVQKLGPIPAGPRKVLVIGASTGYGLATRIAAAFGSGAATLGVFFERPAEGERTATAGWYNTVAFEARARAQGLYAKSLNGDAFCDEMKARTAELVRKDLGPLDMVVYSLAAPRRTDPETGETYRSVLKPVHGPFSNRSFDFRTCRISHVSLEQATADDVFQTVKVMGGEDWQRWCDLLLSRRLLAPGCLTVAYSYIGPEVTYPIYRQGTIGAAKDHLERTARELDVKFRAISGRALVSVNKALVTQASAAIPFIPLYYVLLLKVMKEKGVHEGCIEQIDRLFRDRLYNGSRRDDITTDPEGRVRLDDLELRADIQQEVMERWNKVSRTNVRQLGDVEGYNLDFLKLFGFGFPQVDYGADVDIDQPLHF
jgi:enoyl-[acyl-carrier protein] reductase/trans-2-enoyl-CoA reductase (NAD+)